jgi:ABC-type sulfate transport system substrate-binding protein
VAAKYAAQFPKLKLVTIDDTFRRLAKGAEAALCRWRYF